MKRFWMSAATLVLGLAVAGSVQAGGKSSGPSRSPRSSGSFHRSESFRPSNYYLTYGKSFHHGYYYPGKYHDHWSYRFWDWRYGCNLYYDSGLCCYYYCLPDQCYYPVSYCPYKSYAWQAPTVVSTAVPTAAPATATVPRWRLPPPAAVWLPCRLCCLRPFRSRAPCRWELRISAGSRLPADSRIRVTAAWI